MTDLGADVAVVEDDDGPAALLAGAGGPVAGVVSLLGLGGADRCVRTLALARALGDAGIDAPLWLVTAGAVDAGTGETGVADPEGHQVWGFGAALALERPDRWGGLVDLPAGDPEPGTALALAAALGGAHPANQLAVRAGGVRARRLVRAPAPADARTWTPSGTVLVTGGTGALGAAVARRLADRGAEHLVLVGRRGAAAPGAAELAAELTAAGTGVTLAACDATDRGALAAVLAGIPADRPLTAVVHAAGVLADGTVESLTADGVREVLRVKVEGARLLDELTADLDLDAFVLFSSLAGTVGAAGQANYAAANSHLDALAAALRARGRAATAIAWGPWQGAGMAGADVTDRMRRGGVLPLPVGTALAALERVAVGDDAAVVVADIDWARYGAGLLAGPHRSLVEQLPELRDLAAAGSLPSSDGLEDLVALPPEDRDRLLRRLVRTRVAAVLGHVGGERIGDTTPFRELGFDSLTAIELRNVLAAATGLTLPATVVFDHPSVADLAAHLRDGLVPAAVPARERLAADVDRLAAELAGPDLADDDRDHLLDRLRALLARPAPRAAADAPALDTADAEELYALLDGGRTA
jgi:NAD(P)-dependent dehydrogenase (short-subunit alcohol dehydrogenase family)/acyl carrier protein